jgi:chemotaxis protein methyltransferase CheR
MDIDPVQRHLFLEGIFLRYGYDFRQYSEASLNRRLGAILSARGEGNLIDILNTVLKSADAFHEVLPMLTINTTEFFRDPVFFRSLRENVLPVLKTYPSLRIWSAGCSTGEEVISLSILLSEAGLLERSVIYATDVSPAMIRRAKQGIFDFQAMQSFAKNYTLASGLKSPADYYTADYDLVKFDPKLLENVVFSPHNLATDEVFVEAHLILCRNVLIYFTRDLQNRVFRLFQRSLAMNGFLGIGSKEAIRFSTSAEFFQAIDVQNNIFQLKTGGER